MNILICITELNYILKNINYVLVYMYKSSDTKKKVNRYVL